MKRPVTSTRHQRQLGHDLASEFDALPLHNTLYDTIGDDDQLARLCDAAAACHTASECRRTALGEDAAFGDDIDRAEDRLWQIARQRALEVVTDTCAMILQDGEHWVADGHCEADVMHNAQQEAHEWMQSHPTEANRCDIEEVLIE